MSDHGNLNRREFLKRAAVAAGGAVLLSACQPKVVEKIVKETVEVEKVVEKEKVVKETVAVEKQVEVTKVVEKVVTATPVPTKADQKIPLSITIIGDTTRNEWMKHFAEAFQEKHPEVDLSIHDVLYGEMGKKQLTMGAAGTLWDVSYAAARWFHFTASQGVFAALDPFVDAQQLDIDDFMPAAISSSKFEDKLYGLPYICSPGSQAAFIYNQDQLEEKGIPLPTDDWTWYDMVDIATKTTDKEKGMWGTWFWPGAYFDFCSLSRCWDTDILSPDGLQWLLGTDPANIEIAKMLTDMRGKYACAPKTSETAGVDWAVGNVVLLPQGVFSVVFSQEQIGAKFRNGVVMQPTGPKGTRGYQVFAQQYCMSTACKAKDLAFELMVLETSYECGIYGALDSKYGPNARKSVWADPKVQADSPIYAKCLDWMSKQDGPFPIPWNLRFTELQTMYGNYFPEIVDGGVDFDTGMANMQKACQAIVSLGRP